MAETCTYCGHLPGCYCKCPTREGHRRGKLSHRKEDYAQALDRALVRAEGAEAQVARLEGELAAVEAIGVPHSIIISIGGAVAHKCYHWCYACKIDRILHPKEGE